MGQTGMTKGRPPSKRQQPSDLGFGAGKLNDPEFLNDLKKGMVKNARRAALRIQAEASALESEPEPARRKTGVDYVAEKADVLRSAVYEQSVSIASIAEVRDEGHVVHRVVGNKTADCPLNYLHARVEKKNRISDIQYAAGIRYRADVMALARVGSNTAATIEHLMMAPTLTSEDRWKQINGFPFMAAAKDVMSVKDASGTMLASVYRVRRIEDRLEMWERELLQDLIIRERPVGMISTRWDIPPEAGSVLCRMALWKLARIMENSDREFQAWLAIERQISGEAK